MRRLLPAIAAILSFFMVTQIGHAEFVANKFVLTEQPREVPNITFADSSPSLRNLNAYRGHFVLLNFWATWCAPCVAEIPSLLQTAENLKPLGLILVPVSIDKNPTVVRPFLEKHDFSAFPTRIGEVEDVPHATGVRKVPITLLIDVKGREIGRVVGSADWSSAETIGTLTKGIAKSTAGN